MSARPAHDSEGARIARWAPRGGGTPDEKERFAEAVDRWLAATGEPPEKAASLAKGRRAVEHGWSPQFGSYTSLGSSRAPWDATDFEREADLATLDVDHQPGCPRPRPAVRDLGRRVDGRQAGLLECGHCGASLPLVDRRLDTGAVMAIHRAPRRRGRPGWSPELFHQHVREAEAVTKPPRTTPRIAANFRRLDDERGIEPTSLTRLIGRFGRPKTDLE